MAKLSMRVSRVEIVEQTRQTIIGQHVLPLSHVSRWLPGQIHHGHLCCQYPQSSNRLANLSVAAATHYSTVVMYCDGAAVAVAASLRSALS